MVYRLEGLHTAAKFSMYFYEQQHSIIAVKEVLTSITLWSHLLHLQISGKGECSGKGETIIRKEATEKHLGNYFNA